MRKSSSFRVLLQKIGIKWVDWEGVRRNGTWKERETRKARWRALAGWTSERGELFRLLLGGCISFSGFGFGFGFGFVCDYVRGCMTGDFVVTSYYLSV